MTRKASELLELASNHEVYFLQGGPRKYLCYAAAHLEANSLISLHERHLLSRTIYDSMDQAVADHKGWDTSTQVCLLETLRIIGAVTRHDDKSSEAYAREARKFWDKVIADLKSKGE